MMKCLCCLLMLLVPGTLVPRTFAQQPLLQDIKRPPVIYLEFAANNLSHDAIDLALSTSDFRETETRENADLILHFDRNISHEDRQTNGNKISMSFKWDVTITVLDRKGKEIWKTSAPMPMAVNSEHTEDSWVALLRKTAEYHITKQFLRAVQQ